MRGCAVPIFEFIPSAGVFTLWQIAVVVKRRNYWDNIIVVLIKNVNAFELKK
jgi:hypothetical protein